VDANLQTLILAQQHTCSSISSLVRGLQQAAAGAPHKVAAIRRASHTLARTTGCADSVPAADALVSLAASLWFRQVALDTAAVLQQRHEQLQALVATAGLDSIPALASCLAPANRVRLRAAQSTTGRTCRHW
jgi:hypothetical protein